MRINGVEETEAAATIAELLRRRGIDPGARFVAVALNGTVVRRGDWDNVRVSTDDEVEIVRPFEGG